MIQHKNLTQEKLHQHIKNGKITMAGNIRMKIYGLLSCKSGKRMNRLNRVFFTNEADAIKNGFRPCGNCMKKSYLKSHPSGATVRRS